MLVAIALLTGGLRPPAAHAQPDDVSVRVTDSRGAMRSGLMTLELGCANSDCRVRGSIRFRSSGGKIVRTRPSAHPAVCPGPSSVANGTWLRLGCSGVPVKMGHPARLPLRIPFRDPALRRAAGHGGARAVLRLSIQRTSEDWAGVTDPRRSSFLPPKLVESDWIALSPVSVRLTLR